jgi:translocation and assembly module TamB
MHKYLRRTLYPVLALALLALAVLAISTTDWFHSVLERRVAAQLESLTGARVEIGQLEFSPFTLQITLARLVLHGTEQPASPPLFSARTFAFRLRPISILRRKIMLAALDVNAAEVHLRTQPDGSSNFPGPVLASAAGQVPPIENFMDLAVGRMTIDHTDVYWNAARVAVSLEAQNVAVQMRRTSSHVYQGSLSSAEVRFRMPGHEVPPTTVSSRFEITRAGLNVTELNWRAAGLTGGATLEIKAAPPMEAQAAFHATGSAAQVAKIFGVGPAQAGEVFVTGRAAYQEGVWQSQGRVEGRQLLFRSRSFNSGRIDFSTDYSVASGVLRLPKLKIDALGGVLRARAQVLLHAPAPRFSVRADVERVRLRNLLSALSPGHPLLRTLHWSSSIQGTLDASWTGSWKDLDSHADLQFQLLANLPVAGLPVNGSFRARLTNHHALALNLEALDAQTPGSTFHVHGMIQSSQTQLAVQLTTSDFEEWRPAVEYLAQTQQPIPLALRSPMTFLGALAETGNGPAISGKLAAGTFDFRGWRWNELASNVTISPSSLQVSGGRLRSGNSMLTVDAQAGLQDWQLDPNGSVQLVAHADKTPLEGLKAALGADYPLTGLATGQIELQGTPSNLAGSAEVQVDHGTFANRPFDTLTTGIQVVGSIWNVRKIQLVRGAARVTGQGSFDPATHAFSVALHGEAIPLADFMAASGTEKEAAAPFEGQAAFDLQGSGTLKDVALQTHWNVQDLIVMGMPAGSVHGQIDWQNQKLHATGESTGAGGVLHFSGEVRTEADWPVQFSGDYSGFSLGPWIRLLLNRKFDSPVTSSGTFKVSGLLRRPDSLVIESQVRALRVNASDLSWANAQPIHLRYADRTLRISPFRIQGPSTNLEAEGSARFGEQAALSLSARGESDAKLLSLLDPAMKATGTSKVDLVVNGTPAHPLLFGKLEVQDLNLSYGDFPIRLFGMNGEIRLEGERATVQSLRGTSGGGTVTVQGYMSFGASPVFQVSAKVDQVRLQYPTDFISQLSGTLRLSGTPENSRMDGDLAVRQLYTTPDFSVLNLLSDVGTSGGTPAIGAASSVASKVRLNVQLVSAPTVHLDAQDLRLVADVDLRLQGTLANPVVVGAIHILNGEAVLRGNRYTINRADISMTNPFRTQPALDLEATTRVQRYNLTLDVSGPLSRIKIAYRSDPPLPTADILSLLALGYSRQQEQLATTGQEHLSSVGASALLSEALSSQMTGRIQRLFGVSRIKIDPNVGGPENVAGARVTVEQQVTRDLTITYITDTGSSQRRVVQFEWQMDNNLSLFGVRDRNGIFGLELRFRRRFK